MGLAMSPVGLTELPLMVTTWTFWHVKSFRGWSYCCAVNGYCLTAAHGHSRESPATTTLERGNKRRTTYPLPLPEEVGIRTALDERSLPEKV